MNIVGKGKDKIIK